MPRFYCPLPLATEALLDLPAGAARHVQVIRPRPGDSITLLNSRRDIAGDEGRPTSPGVEFDNHGCQVIFSYGRLN